MAVGRRADAVQIVGLADFQRELRALDRRFGSELRKMLKDAAEVTAEAAERRARAMGGVIAKAAPSIRAASEQRAAKVAWGSAREPWALGAIMGAKAYKQFRPWVGSTWEVGGPGGPYAVNEAIRDTRDELEDQIGDGFERLAGRAFPR